MAHVLISNDISLHSDTANIQVRLTFFENVRGTEQLYFQGYKFRSNKSLGEKTYWECVVPHYTVRVTTANTRLQHHPAQQHNLAAVLILMLLRRLRPLLHKVHHRRLAIGRRYNTWYSIFYHIDQSINNDIDRPSVYWLK